MFMKIVTDRRTLYSVLIVVIVVPYLVPFELPIAETKEVESLFDFIDNEVAPSGKPVIISMDFDPSTQGECRPMAEAVLRHCFIRDIRVIVTTFIPSGIGLSKQILWKIAQEMEKRNNEDYVFLGFKPSFVQVILNMGKDFKKAYPTDAAGTDIGLIKAMEGVKNFDDIGLIISISGTPIPESWIFFAYQYYQANVAVGTTAVSATTYFPYFQAGQIKGFLPGISGAGAYEQMLDRMAKKQGVEMKQGDATASTSSQAVAHVVIIIFIIIGNISFFVNKARRAAAQ